MAPGCGKQNRHCSNTRNRESEHCAARLASNQQYDRQYHHPDETAGPPANPTDLFLPAFGHRDTRRLAPRQRGTSSPAFLAGILAESRLPRRARTFAARLLVRLPVARQCEFDGETPDYRGCNAARDAPEAAISRQPARRRGAEQSHETVDDRTCGVEHHAESQDLQR